MRGRAVRIALGLLVPLVCLAGCERRTPPKALRVEIPERASCPANDEQATPARPVKVRVVLLCMDNVYGDFGVPETRFVEPSAASPLELAVRELFECCPNRAEDLLSVTLSAGVATLNFPADYQRSEDWNNVSTSAGNLAFFPSLEATVFQFPEVQRIAASFGGERWWPMESEYFDLARPDDPLPLRPRALDRRSPVAAVRLVADALRDDYADEDWYRRIRLLRANAQFVFVETSLDPLDEVTGAKVEAAVDEILNRDRQRWCHVLVGVNGDGQGYTPTDPGPRCDDRGAS